MCHVEKVGEKSKVVGAHLDSFYDRFILRERGLVVFTLKGTRWGFCSCKGCPLP